MADEEKSAYELANEGVLSNELLTKWLINLEERVHRLESSLSPSVTWEVSQAELAETEKGSEE